MKSLRIWCSHFLPWVHPGIESLLQHAEGHRSVHVEAHLACCATCRDEAELLAGAIRAARAPASPNGPPLEEVFDVLQRRVAAWCSLGRSATRRQPGTSQPRHPGLAAALELYFGNEVSSRLQRSEPWNAPPVGLISAAKPLFSAFLGREAADALTRRIADAVT